MPAPAPPNETQVDWDECVNELSGGKCKLNTCDTGHQVSTRAVPLVVNPEAKSQEVLHLQKRPTMPRKETCDTSKRDLLFLFTRAVLCLW